MARWPIRDPVGRGATALFIVLCLVYLFSIDIRASRGASITGDEPFYLLTTQSLLEDGDFDLTQQYERRSYESFFDHPDGLWRQSVPNEDGVLLSPHNPGLSLLVIPGFAMGGLPGVQVQLVLLAAATMALTYVLVAWLSGSAGTSWLATAAVGLGATPFVYSSEVYPEFPAAFFLVGALLVTTRGRGVAAAFAVAVALTAIMWLGVKYAPLVAIVAGVFLLRGTKSGRLALLGLGGLSAAAFAWGHLELFGALTPYSVGTVHQGMATDEVLGAHIDIRDQAYRLYGIFIDGRFGIARWAPLLFLGVIGAPLLFRRHFGSLGPAVFLLLLAQLVVAAFVVITMMGWWFPGRTMMTVLPLFALPITLALQARPRAGMIAFALLAVYSVAVTIALAIAGHREEVVIAVDPFDMGAAVFAWPSPLFPQYTSWTTHTWAATGGWLIVVAVAFVLFYWPQVARATARIRAAVGAVPEAARRT